MKLDLVPARTCRLCGSPKLDLVLALPPSPIGDAFVPVSERDVFQPSYPLDLNLCRECGHAQLGHVLDPEVLFRNYLFETQSSLGLVEHFRKYAAELLVNYPAQAGDLVVEIGSNDGSFLKCFQNAGLRVLGVDPAERPAASAVAAGIPTLTEFFTTELAKAIRREHGPATFVTANNVFAHADELRDMALGVRELLAPNGIFVFEVSYLLDMVEKLLFDTIYHEHLSYHAVKPLVEFLQRAGLALIDVERIGTKGGSIRCFVQLAGASRDISPRVAELLALEQRIGLDRPDVFLAMQRRIGELRDEVLERMDPLLNAGHEVAGYGASPTATTLMYAFGLQDRLTYLVDDNPLKQGQLSPGRHLPVWPSAELYQRRPTMVVILAWNYAEPIRRRHEAFLSSGGRFLVPLPAVNVW